MRTRLFLRTTEFLWQEGHTAHASAEEAEQEVQQILEIYRCLAEDYLAIPVIKGIKTEREKFAGAEKTYCLEAMMQDHRALQIGTSHNLGQIFAKAFDVTFQDKNGKRQYVWATSWGVSTRLIGALIMTHSDDKGLVIPPRMAVCKVVIVPIVQKGTNPNEVLLKAHDIAKQTALGHAVKVDERTQVTPGWKYHYWEQRGIPLRIEVGPREIANNQVVLVRRDTGTKQCVSQNDLKTTIEHTLNAIQANLFERACSFRDKYTFYVDHEKSFREKLDNPGGFILAHHCGNTECEERIQAETKATIRCIPLDAKSEQGHCLFCGKPCFLRVIFARGY
jgi:prolyl-tRNA synthetase